ncbi:MAG: hypothetical protein WCR98_07970, partial [Saccharofermentanales bacterium]
LRWPKAGDVYLEMSSNDPVITAILHCSRQLIRNVTWDVTPASQTKADLEAAAFLKECMDDMSATWSDFIDDCTSFFDYGFSYHEIVYKRRMGPSRNPHKNSKFTDGRIGWRKIAGRAQTSMHSWKFDDEGGLQGMYQYTSDGIKFIPIQKSLLFRTTANRGNPEGKSFLRGAYRPWYFKKHIEEIEGIGIERDLAGLPVTTAPPGIDIFDKENPKAVEAKNAALKLVTSIRRDRNEGVVLPDGWKLDLLSSSSSRQFDTSTIINRYDQRIAITMLADIVMLGADKVGSFALAKVKQSMLSASLDAQLASVCDIFNRYAIPRLFALNNFNVTKLPTIKSGSVVAPDLKELGDYIKALSGSKMPLFPDVDLENHLRRIADLPETKEDDEGREARIARSNQNGSNGANGQNSSGGQKDPADPAQKGGENDE